MNKVGVPKGVYNVVHGFGPDSAGAFLTSHPGVNGITFTGQTGTGTAIMKAGAEGIRPVSLELGGKNAALVFADCDLDVAVNTVTRSAFENCGQVCLGTERVYVERPVFDKFVTALKAKAEGMTPGRPDDPATKGRWSARNIRTRCCPTTRKRKAKARRSSSAAGSRTCWRS